VPDNRGLVIGEEKVTKAMFVPCSDPSPEPFSRLLLGLQHTVEALLHQKIGVDLPYVRIIAFGESTPGQARRADGFWGSHETIV